MKYTIIICLLYLMTDIALSQITIINDSGNFQSKFKVEAHGFFIFREGHWNQDGANTKYQNINTFLNKFSPDITNNGINIVTCEFNDIGWIWPTSGKNTSKTYSFLTGPTIQSWTQMQTITGVPVHPSGFICSYSTSQSEEFVSITVSLTATKSISSETSLSCSENNGTRVSLTGNLKVIQLSAEMDQSSTYQIIDTIGFSYSNSISLSIELHKKVPSFNPETEVVKGIVNILATEIEYQIIRQRDVNHDGISEGLEMQFQAA